MKKNKPLPDLGKYLFTNIGKQCEIDFDIITITNLSRIEPELYTTAVSVRYDNKKFMASFDFSENQIAFILKNLFSLDEEFASELIHYFNVPFEDVQDIEFEERPIKLMATITLGEIQESSIQDEVFVPLVVKAIQAIA